MIKNFKNKKLEDFFCDGKKKGISADHVQKLMDILDRLDAVHVVKDINYPGSSLQCLKGKLKGTWVVTISGNWRLTFRFEDGQAHYVDYLDYH
ncbi:hypothetical protein MNBD_UNCLBAC01-1351 [hydrothermal vent metagenome]|uniref:Toxin HigB n=1 Tax=hydrothermal vent metagenome TaxID=652676 RepID=A0A3B1D5C0_9ZZZZ